MHDREHDLVILGQVSFCDGGGPMLERADLMIATTDLDRAQDPVQGFEKEEHLEAQVHSPHREHEMHIHGHRHPRHQQLGRNAASKVGPAVGHDEKELNQREEHQ